MELVVKFEGVEEEKKFLRYMEEIGAKVNLTSSSIQKNQSKEMATIEEKSYTINA